MKTWAKDSEFVIQLAIIAVFGFVKIHRYQRIDKYWKIRKILILSNKILLFTNTKLEEIKTLKYNCERDTIQDGHRIKLHMFEPLSQASLSHILWRIFLITGFYFWFSAYFLYNFFSRFFLWVRWVQPTLDPPLAHTVPTKINGRFNSIVYLAICKWHHVVPLNPQFIFVFSVCYSSLVCTYWAGY